MNRIDFLVAKLKAKQIVRNALMEHKKAFASMEQNATQPQPSAAPQPPQATNALPPGQPVR